MTAYLINFFNLLSIAPPMSQVLSLLTTVHSHVFGERYYLLMTPKFTSPASDFSPELDHMYTYKTIYLTFLLGCLMRTWIPDPCPHPVLLISVFSHQLMMLTQSSSCSSQNLWSHSWLTPLLPISKCIRKFFRIDSQSGHFSLLPLLFHP